MIYIKNNELVLADEMVTFERNGKVYEEEVGEEGKEWWFDFEKKWENMKIINFKKIEFSEEQLLRLEEIKELELNNCDAVGEYVETGTFPIGSHKLKALEIEKEIKKDKDIIDALTLEILKLKGLM